MNYSIVENNTVLIFGANGQDGYYLNNLLQAKGFNVVKISRRNADVCGDVSDFVFVSALIQRYLPSYIFHLAANSTTQHYALFENHLSISTGTLNILESAKLHCSKAKIFISGSAMQFKNSGMPIDEQTTFEASSPYSIARIQSVYAARYYRKAFGLKVYVGYFFNHDSPLRTEKHINQKIAKAAQRIVNGSKESLKLGNVDVQKEFSYAGDIVEAIWLLINQDNVFEAVIGSGKAYKIKDWVECCFGHFKLDWEDFVVLEENFVPEYTILISNPQLMMGLGWQPKVDIAQLANMMINE